MIVYILIVAACMGVIAYSEYKHPGENTQVEQIAEDVLEGVTGIDVNGDGKIGRSSDGAGNVDKK